MPTVFRDVRFQGQSGKHLLALSFSGFDPQRSCIWRVQGTARRRALQRAVHRWRIISDNARALPRDDRGNTRPSGPPRHSGSACQARGWKQSQRTVGVVRLVPGPHEPRIAALQVGRSGAAVLATFARAMP